MLWRSPKKRLLSAPDEQRVLDAIREAEARTSGEIRVHLVRRARRDPRTEAERWFVRLGMYATRERNGVLFWLAVEDRKFAVAGDSGIHEHVGDAFWERLRDMLEEHFLKGDLAEGLVRAVDQVGGELSRFFPLAPEAFAPIEAEPPPEGPARSMLLHSPGRGTNLAGRPIAMKRPRKTPIRQAA